MIYDAPARVRSVEPSRRHAKSASHCPAIIGFESRYLEVKCPFGLSQGPKEIHVPQRWGGGEQAGKPA